MWIEVCERLPLRLRTTGSPEDEKRGLKSGVVFPSHPLFPMHPETLETYGPRLPFVKNVSQNKVTEMDIKYFTIFIHALINHFLLCFWASVMLSPLSHGVQQR